MVRCAITLSLILPCLWYIMYAMPVENIDEPNLAAVQKTETLIQEMQTYAHKLLRTPAFVRDDSFFQQLVVIVAANCQPVTQFAIVKCVSHFEDLSSGERKTLWSFLLKFKVGPDVERVSPSRCQNVLIH